MPYVSTSHEEISIYYLAAQIHINKTQSTLSHKNTLSTARLLGMFNHTVSLFARTVSKTKELAAKRLMASYLFLCFRINSPSRKSA